MKEVRRVYYEVMLHKNLKINKETSLFLSYSFNNIMSNLKLKDLTNRFAKTKFRP